jgi:DNA-binding response OmpR family regulator
MHRILVVDDDKKIVTALSLRLQNEGYVVVCAYDAATAFEECSKGPFSLIVMDINLPFANGVKTTRKIKEIAAQADTPVIFITASKLPSLRLQAETLGASGFFEKPYEPKEVLNRIRELLGDPVQG